MVREFSEFPSHIRKGFVRALNRAVASARTVMVREIARDTGLRSKDVRDALLMSEATQNRPEARLAASLKKIPLIKFRARGPFPSRGRGRGVTYRLTGSRGRHPNAFIARMKSGHEGVFKRADSTSHKSAAAWSKNLPIIELHGPSLGHVFAKYRPLAAARAREVFETNLDHEMSWKKKASSHGAGTD